MKLASTVYKPAGGHHLRASIWIPFSNSKARACGALRCVSNSKSHGRGPGCHRPSDRCAPPTPDPPAASGSCAPACRPLSCAWLSVAAVAGNEAGRQIGEFRDLLRQLDAATTRQHQVEQETSRVRSVRTMPRRCGNRRTLSA